MQISEMFRALGEDGFAEVMRTVTISKLKTYKLYENLKARAHLPKLNVAGLKKATPRFFERLDQGDEDLAGDLAQAVLVSNLDMIVAILDHLGLEHRDGYFDKGYEADDVLKEGWRKKTFEHFQNDYPKPLLVFYLNHLAHETTKAEDLFTPAGAK